MNRDKILNELYDIYSSCRLCPRNCKVNRLKNEIGECKIGKNPVVSSFFAHFGEEPPLVGYKGSGTIFFSGCNLHCVYCQNHDISQYVRGEEVSPERLADIMLYLQAIGTHNINLVSPTHVVPPIVEAIFIARDKGLNLPIVYNTGGYDSLEVIKLLDGIIDIYMPDTKYSDAKYGEIYSDVKNYPAVNRAILKEMYRQVGDLITDEFEIARKGMIIRHLVLPNNIAGSKDILDFIRFEISEYAYVNIMRQYHPAYKAYEYPELSRRIYYGEYEEVVEYAKKIGLKNAVFS